MLKEELKEERKIVILTHLADYPIFKTSEIPYQPGSKILEMHQLAFIVRSFLNFLLVIKQKTATQNQICL